MPPAGSVVLKTFHLFVETLWWLESVLKLLAGIEHYQKWEDLGIDFLSIMWRTSKSMGETDLLRLNPSVFQLFAHHPRLRNGLVSLSTTQRRLVSQIALNEIFSHCSFWQLIKYCFMESKMHSPAIAGWQSSKELSFGREILMLKREQELDGTVCLPKQFGGVGIQRLALWNLALKCLLIILLRCGSLFFSGSVAMVLTVNQMLLMLGRHY